MAFTFKNNLWYLSETLENDIEKYQVENKKKNTECVVQRTVIQDTEILSRLDEIREEIEASRVSITCFHNGGEYYSGRSMQKLSCAYESVSPGISRTQLSIQNIPVSSCLTTISNLIEHRERRTQALLISDRAVSWQL